MFKLLINFATYDGHTGRIAERIAKTACVADCAAEVCDLARMQAKRPLRAYDGVIAGPLHGGKHPSQRARFVSESLQFLNDRPSAFFSVSLSAASNEDQRKDATRCLKCFLEEYGWQPASTSIVAGAILYQDYGFLKRWLMKRIAKGGGGDTDTSKNYVTQIGMQLTNSLLISSARCKQTSQHQWFQHETRRRILREPATLFSVGMTREDPI